MDKRICLNNIGIDCRDALKLRDFYAGLLGWEKREMYACPALRSPEGVVFLFDQAEDYGYVSPVWPEQPGKQQKQMHFDFLADDLPFAVAEAERFGAVRAGSQYGGDQFVTMFDPEGHPFCLCAK